MIGMNWDEALKTFTIKERKGGFPGMLENRTFKIVWVNMTNGTGTEPSKQVVIVQYSGKEIKIRK